MYYRKPLDNETWLVSHLQFYYKYFVLIVESSDSNLYTHGRNKELRFNTAYLLNLWLLFCHLGQVVSASSWIQFIKATRTLIAVPIQSHFKSQTSISYQIEAINSAGKKAYSKFTASLKDTPYTSDCKMSMDFRYMYQTENLVDLDLILIFINKVSEFYSDSRNSIKFWILQQYLTTIIELFGVTVHSNFKLDKKLYLGYRKLINRKLTPFFKGLYLYKLMKFYRNLKITCLLTSKF